MMSGLQPYLEHQPLVEQGVYIAPGATVIGRVTIGEDASLWPGCIIRGDVNSISIGRYSNIQDAAVLHVTQPTASQPEGYALTLGEGVTVGHRAVLHGCSIGNYCLIGIGAIIMDGAVIEDEVMIGAGSLVPPGKRLESGFLYVGAPVRKARELSHEERQFLTQSSRNYIRLKNAYLAM